LAKKVMPRSEQPASHVRAVSIFLYVGAEVAIGSSAANYLMLDSTLSAAAQTAGTLVSIWERQWWASSSARIARGKPSGPCAVRDAFVATVGLSAGTLAATTGGRPVQFDHVSDDFALRSGHGRADAAGVGHISLASWAARLCRC
jgi:hypothetical protein